MRKLSLLAVAGLLAAPAVTEAKTLDELLVEKGVVSAEQSAGSVHYKGGSRLDFGEDFHMKVNIQLQPRYEFEDEDTKGRRDAGVADADSVDNDTSGFNLRRARVIFSGHMLNKTWSYKLQNDFASNGGGGDLKDAWLEWNGDESANVRLGQFKNPLSRQENASSAKLQFPDRSSVNDFFQLDRNNGVMVHGDVSGLMYGFNVWNGESDGEGRNRGPVDNKIAGTAAVAYNLGDYGDRDHEGDIEGTDGFAMTFGAAVNYGEGETLAEGDFEKLDLNGDIGMRMAGLSVQSEVYWSDVDYDAIEGDAGERSDVGAYIQAGYFFVPQEWEAAVRYGLIKFDDDVDARDDEQEISLALNYHIWGHALKLQNAITFLQTTLAEEGPDGDDYMDFLYTLQLSGYF